MKFRYTVVCIFLMLLNACVSQNKGKLKNEIVISKWVNSSNDTAQKIESLQLYFGVGFDDIEHFKVYLNEKLIIEFSGKTNYSIGMCEHEDVPSKICTFPISHKKIKRNSRMKIEINSEYVELVFPDDIHNYNRLFIGRQKKWEASFQKSFEPIILE